MEVIDFKKLLRQERKRAKQKKKERELQSALTVLPSDTERKKKQNSVDRGDCDNDEQKPDVRYDWKYPVGFLSFKKLALMPICEDPRSISYSATALEKQTLQVPNATENDAVAINITSASDGLEPCVPNRTTKAMSSMISPEKALVNWLQSLPNGDSGLGEWKAMSYGKRKVCMFGEETNGSLPPPLAEIARDLVERNVFPPSLCPPPNHVLLNEYQPGQGIFPHTDGPRYEHRTATLSLESDVVIEFTKRLASSEIGIGSSKRLSSIPTKVTGIDHPEAKEGNGNPRKNEDNDDNSAPSLVEDTGDSPSNASPIQVLLESGSLLVFQGDAYLNYCHGIGMDVWRDITTDHCLNAPSGKIVPRGLRYSLTFRHKKSETKKLQ